MADAARKTGATLPTEMSVAEFRAWPGDGKGGRYQLVDGEVRAMSPATTTHNIIQGNTYALIAAHLHVPGAKCTAMPESAVSVRIRSEFNQRVADVGVTCTPDAPGQVEIIDPILLVEVISPGNKRETWDNVWAYTTIPSVDEVLIISSFEISAEILRRQPDRSWPPETIKLGRDDVIKLDSIGFSAPLIEVFARTYLVRAG